MLKRVMIVSGESSGELYGALLAKAIKKRHPEISIIGVGGDKMQSSGVNLISRISSSFGIIEALKTYSDIRRTFKKVVSALKSFNPQVVVLIDYPDFNMSVAKEAKRLGIKVLYYVSPQVWAWRQGRVKKIGRLIDRMAVILPFEEEIYRDSGIPCEFVGHPVMDEIREVLQEFRVQSSEFRVEQLISSNLKSRIKESLGLIPDRPVMTLMPGSRTHEIKRLISVMVDVIKAIKERYPDYQFAIPIAPNLNCDVLSVMSNELEKNTHYGLHITHNAIKALLASDIAIIASGTSALQATFLGVPMVVVYKLSPVTYFIGRLVVKVKHITLTNILLDKSIKDDSGLRIKELLQGDANKENIMAEVVKIIEDSEYRDNMLSQLKRVRRLFLNKEASTVVAGIVEELGG